MKKINLIISDNRYDANILIIVYYWKYYVKKSVSFQLHHKKKLKIIKQAKKTDYITPNVVSCI